MLKRKSMALLAGVIVSLCVTTLSALAVEFEEADYIKISSYSETMIPANETDGILSVSVEGTVGQDGYLYLMETIKGMELTGEVSGENLDGKLEPVTMGSVNYYRVKAADASAPVSVTAAFTCAGFYAPEMKADTNGGNNYPISYKFTNFLHSAIGTYNLQVFIPEGHQIVKVSTPSAYADFILDEVDGMRSVGLSGSVKAGAASTLSFTYNTEPSVMETAAVWVICLGVGLAVLIDRVRKARQ